MERGSGHGLVVDYGDLVEHICVIRNGKADYPCRAVILIEMTQKSVFLGINQSFIVGVEVNLPHTDNLMNRPVIEGQTGDPTD